MKAKAIFIDRDGTINEEMGYINHLDRFIVFPFVAPSIQIFNQLGYKVIIVTNQSGVARGYFNIALLKELHERLMEQIQTEGGIIDAIYYCPHHPTEGSLEYRMECDCRKPKPGMVHRAVEEFEINLKTSYMIGDRYKDIVFANQLGLTSGFVMTGYGRGEYLYQRQQWEVKPDLIGENLLDIAKQIKEITADKK